MKNRDTLRDTQQTRSGDEAPGTEARLPRNGIRYRVVAYLRVSLDDNKTGSHTFETQELRVRERLDNFYGPNSYEVEMLRDDGVSGGYGPETTKLEKRTRKNLKAALDMIGTGDYDGFIVYSFSRYCRSTRWFHQILEDHIYPAQVDFLSATEFLDFTSPSGRAMAGMIAVMDASYRESGALRCKDAAATRFQLGYHIGSVGYGWETDRGAESPNEKGSRPGIRPVPEEGEYIVRMKNWYLCGKSTGWVAGELNKLGALTPSGKPGVRWSAQAVRNILDSPLHAGLIAFDGELREGRHFENRYYEPEDYHQIRADCARRRSWTPPSSQRRVHLLTPLAVCARCGAKLRPSRVGGEYVAYRCENGLSQGERTCKEVTVKAAALEDAVVRELGTLAADPAIRQVLLEETERCVAVQRDHAATDRPRLQNRIRELDKALETLLVQLTKETISQAQFEGTNVTLRSERDAVQAELTGMENTIEQQEVRLAQLERVREIVLDFPYVWKHLGDDERKNVVSLLVESLSVDRRGNSRNKPDVTLRIKVVLLPEKEVSVYIRTGYRDKTALSGVESLTERQLVLLYHLGQGKSREETSQLMGIRRTTFNQFAYDIRKRLGMQDLGEAARLANRRILSLLPSLNLGAIERENERRETSNGMPGLTGALMDIFPLLANGAKPMEVAQITGLPYTTVATRYQRILELFETKSIFEAGQKARKRGLLS